MDNDCEMFSVPIKNLEKSHDLPPQYFFANAQGVLHANIGIKIQQRSHFSLLKLMKSNPFVSRPVYFVINTGYLFIYKSQSHGYAIKVKEDGGCKLSKNQDPKDVTRFGFQFKNIEIKFEFNDFDVYDQWWLLLKDVANSKVTEDKVQRNARKYADYAFAESLKYAIIAQRAPREKGETERVDVYRYPLSITTALEETEFNATILDSPRKFTPLISSTRRSEDEIDYDDTEIDGSQPQPPPPLIRQSSLPKSPTRASALPFHSSPPRYQTTKQWGPRVGYCYGKDVIISQSPAPFKNAPRAAAMSKRSESVSRCFERRQWSDAPRVAPPTEDIQRPQQEEEPAAEAPPRVDEAFKERLSRFVSGWPSSAYSGAAAIEAPQQPGAGVLYAHRSPSNVVAEEEKEDMQSPAQADHLTPPNIKTPTRVPPSQKRAYQEGRTPPVRLANVEGNGPMPLLQFDDDETAMEAPTTTTTATTTSSSTASSSTRTPRTPRYYVRDEPVVTRSASGKKIKKPERYGYDD